MVAAVTIDRYDDLMSRLYKVLYEDVPMCGCGDPAAAYRLVYDLLRLTPWYEEKRWEQAQQLIGTDGAFQIVVSALTEADLLDRGGSIGGSWITEGARREVNRWKR